MSPKESAQSSIQATSASERDAATLGYRWAVLFAMVIIHTTTAATFNTLPVLTPFLQQDFRLTAGQLGAYISANFLGSALTQIPGGWAADALGTRRAIFWGVLASGICFAVFSQAPTHELALILTVIVGLGMGFASPGWTKAITLWFPPRNRATAVGINQMSNPLSGLIVSFTLPLLAIATSWRVSSLVVAVVVLVSVVIAFAIYRQHPTGERQPVSKAGSRDVGPLRQVLTNRNVWLVGIFGNLLIGAQAIFLGYLLLYLRDELLLSVVVAARFLGLGQMGGGLARIGWGYVSDRFFGGKRTRVLGLILVLTAAASLATALIPVGMPWWLLVPLVVLFGGTAVGWHGVYLTLLAESVPHQATASAVGLGMALFNVGGIAGPPLFGALVDHTGSYRLGWGLLAAAVLTGLPLLRFIHEGQNND
ncbi:MAG: MFS transporter [Chloroflexi bacterium]|nr:MFS transporter [Chloroflexota bacterium]